jgi:hypothetical protein
MRNSCRQKGPFNIHGHVHVRVPQGPPEMAAPCLHAAQGKKGNEDLLLVERKSSAQFLMEKEV